MDRIKEIGNEYQGLVFITSVVGSFFYGLLQILNENFQTSGINFPASLILSGTVVIVVLGVIWSFHNWRKLKEVKKR